jgi:hypothetical protein
LTHWLECDFASNVERDDDDADALEAACKQIVSTNSSKWAEYNVEFTNVYYEKFPHDKPASAAMNV